MLERKLPSAVMYQDLKGLGIANRDLARVLLDLDRKIGGGKTIRDEVESRSLLSRKYVKAAPGQLDEDAFRPFSESAQDLLSRLLNASKLTVPELEAHFAGPASRKMERALAENGIDPSPYANALERVKASAYPDPQDRLLLALMLFVICGCLASPKRAVLLEEQFAEETLGVSIRTATAMPGQRGAEEAGDEKRPLSLGIVRIFEGMAMSENYALHVLPQTEQGATIGSGACDITDVDASVSRKHARVYCEDGRWFIVGLGSTNGTTVENGVSGSTTVVEPPRSERKRGYRPEPVEIGPADILHLGTTSYIVRAVNRG